MHANGCVRRSDADLACQTRNVTRLTSAQYGRHLTACQTAGRPLPSQGGRGKSGLHGNTVPDNVRRGRPQGKCHRKQTARASAAARQPAGKGETGRQERTAPLATGAAGQTPPGARPNRDGGARKAQEHSRSVVRVGRARRAARRVLEEWPSRTKTVRTEPGLQAVWHFAPKLIHRNKIATTMPLTR